MLRRKMVYGILVFVLVFISCGDRPNTVPNIGRFSFTVPIYSTNLIHVGGHHEVRGGYEDNGIVIYRVDMSTFCAYDRTCPYDWQEGGRVTYNSATLQLVCDECGSAFNILDGLPMSDSKAKNFLRRYNAILIDDMTLRVYN